MLSFNTHHILRTYKAFLKKVFFETKYTRILSFLVEDYIIQTDIITYFLLPPLQYENYEHKNKIAKHL